MTDLKFGDMIKVDDALCRFVSEKDGYTYFLKKDGDIPRRTLTTNVLPAPPLHEEIRDFREKLGKTQKTFGQLLKVSRVAVARWEADKAVPSAENMVKLDKIRIYLRNKK